MLPTSPANLTAQGTILGTLQYMAPEQIEGKDADARTDIFAFGAVLYEMLAAGRRSKGNSQASLMAAILEREPPRLDSPRRPCSTDRSDLSGQGSGRSLADRTRSLARAAVARRRPGRESAVMGV